MAQANTNPEFLTVDMEVTKSVEIAGKTTREPIGSIKIHVPTLFALVSTAVQLKDADKPVFTDDGLPVYENDAHNFIQDAIYASVKAQARNRLVSKTATLKDGLAIATNWVELTADSGGTSGAHLALIREVVQLFTAFVGTLGKSAQVQLNIVTMFSKLPSLKTAEAGVKDKIAGYVNDFLGTLTDDQVTKYSKYLTKVADTASSAPISADDY